MRPPSSALFLAFLAGLFEIVPGQSCIYNAPLYGLGTGYRLDSIVGPDGPDGKTFLEVNAFDSQGNPVSKSNRKLDMVSPPKVLTSSYRLALRDGILSTEVIGAPLQFRDYLNAAFLADSLSVSNDSGRTFRTITRHIRSGDTLRSEYWVDPLSATATETRMKIAYSAGDSILTFRIFPNMRELMEICRPQGDTCSCTDPASPKRFTEYVVENGFLKYTKTEDGERWYSWRSLSSISIRRPKTETAAGRGGEMAWYTTDGRRATVKMGRAGIGEKPAGAVFPMR